MILLVLVLVRVDFAVVTVILRALLLILIFVECGRLVKCFEQMEGLLRLLLLWFQRPLLLQLGAVPLHGLQYLIDILDFLVIFVEKRLLVNIEKHLFGLVVFIVCFGHF